MGGHLSDKLLGRPYKILQLMLTGKAAEKEVMYLSFPLQHDRHVQLLLLLLFWHLSKYSSSPVAVCSAAALLPVEARCHTRGQSEGVEVELQVCLDSLCSEDQRHSQSG